MKNTAEELRAIVREYSKKFESIPDHEFSAKPLVNKWSKKEVVGHLIDSAQNNLRRFIVGQYETIPSKIVYDQNIWVATNDYQSMTKEDVISLWRLINARVAAVLENMPRENYLKQSMTSELHTLEFLAVDYVKHLKHHINQVIAGSFEIVYQS
jgi:hypothetical protein